MVTRRIGAAIATLALLLALVGASPVASAEPHAYVDAEFNLVLTAVLPAYAGKPLQAMSKYVPDEDAGDPYAGYWRGIGTLYASPTGRVRWLVDVDSLMNSYAEAGTFEVWIYDPADPTLQPLTLPDGTTAEIELHLP